MLAGIGGLVGGDDNAVVTVSNNIIFNSGSSGTVYARVKVDNDGNIYKSEDSGTPSWTQVATSTDWIRPTSFAPDDYEVRFTAASNTPTSSTTAEDTWHPLSSGDWIIYNSRTSTGTTTTEFSLEIRKGSSGGALDSGAYILSADFI